MQNTLGIFILLLLSLSIQAQEKFTLSGVVKDINNGETLIGATVQLKGTNYGTITNEYGFYSLSAPAGEYRLVYSYLGYGIIEQGIQLDKNLKLNIELEEQTAQMQEVVVVAENPDQANIETPQMSVNKLSVNKIKEIPVVLGEVDVIKSIQLLPGVSNAGEGASGFNVRGGAEDQNLVLLDEAIIYNTSHLFGFFSVFNADAVKDVKLYKGGIPARFGGRASSVLDIRQRDGNSKKLGLTGGIGAISSRLAVEGPTFKDKGSFLLAGRAAYANVFLTLLSNDNRVGFYDANFKTNYDINDNNRIFLSGYVGRDVFTIANSFSNTYGNVSGNLRWNHLFSDKLFSNLSLIYSRYNYGLEINQIALVWDSDIENYNLKYDLGYYLNDKLTLNFGVSGIYYNINPGLLNPLDSTSPIVSEKLDDKFAFESAAYLSAEHKITDQLTAQYGLSYSYFSRMGAQSLNEYESNLPVVYNSDLGIYERGTVIGQTDFTSGSNIKTFGNIEPRLALSYQLNSHTSVKASYNRNAQYLHLISNTTSATPLDVWAPSGKYIAPQIADQYAVGYFKNFDSNRYALEVEAYYKIVDGRVDYIDGAELIAQNTIETEILQGESRAYGMEFLLRKNTGKITGWLAYTLSKAEQRAVGGLAGGPGINNGLWYNTVFDRTHDLSLTATYQLNGKWRFGANFIFQTGRPVTYPDGQFRYNGLSIASYANRNTNRLPAYHRLDISATLTPRKNKNRKWDGEWVFSIYNVYNRRNAASISFSQNTGTALNEATRTAIFGIIPSVTYNFKF
ncbi:MAG: TonB-dependent receptor [Bacteroidota bacterium]